jgi:hypothetical protein
MQFSYFDLNLGKYKTISATEVMVTVLDGPTLTDATASNEENSKDKISSKEQFKSIKLKTNLVAVAKDDFLGSKLFYGLLFLPFYCCLSLYCLRREKKSDGDVVGNRIRRNNKLAKKYLSQAKNKLIIKNHFT